MSKRILCIYMFLSLVATPTMSVAEDISFTAEISSNKVALGSSVQLILTINGATQLGEINIPDFEGFDVNYIGPSTHVSIVNGKYYSSKSFTYSLIPHKIGTYLIQSLSATIKGKTYTTGKIEIEVIDASAQISPQSQSGKVSLSDKINLVLRVPKKEVYINEALPVKIMLLVRDLSVRDIRYPSINSVGFMVGEFGQPKQYKQIIKGVRYDIVEFDTVIYPTRTGELTIGPGQLDCNLIVTSSQRRSLGSLFNDDFFNALFDRAEKKPITLESEPVHINVLNLPKEGKPKDFSGAVGDYHFEASATPNDVSVGDPVTLRMKIKGRGNLKAIIFPGISDDANFKVYKPNVKEKTNFKTLEQVIIPNSENISKVPALQFSFFDPQLKKYRTIVRGPFPLTVKKLEGDQTLNIFGHNLSRAPHYFQEEELGEDIVFIKEKLGTLKTVDKPISKSPLVIFIVTLIFLGWATGYGHYNKLRFHNSFLRVLKHDSIRRRIRAIAKGY